MSKGQRSGVDAVFEASNVAEERRRTPVEIGTILSPRRRTGPPRLSAHWPMASRPRPSSTPCPQYSDSALAPDRRIYASDTSSGSARSGRGSQSTSSARCSMPASTSQRGIASSPPASMTFGKQTRPAGTLQVITWRATVRRTLPVRTRVAPIHDGPSRSPSGGRDESSGAYSSANICHVTRKSAAITGPATKPASPNTVRPPRVASRTR